MEDKYIVDHQGKWLVQGCCKLLVEPSESYLAEQKQRMRDDELLRNLTPTADEVLAAQIEIHAIALLQEVGLI